MKKKFLAVAMAAAMVVGLLAGFTGCSGSKDSGDVKVGFIMLEDENAGYTKNFLDAVDAVKEKMELSDDQIVIKTNVSDADNSAYEAACDLVDSGCNVVFGNSFGYENYMLQAAKENPEVQFCHGTGTQAHTAGLDNFHNAFAKAFDARYVSGIAAGMKLNEMIKSGEITEKEAVMGYVGAYPFAEVKSGYTAFYLGAKSVCPSVTMNVKFTSSWGDKALEYEYAKDLISKGAKIVSGHADTIGAPTACEENGKVFECAYNYPTSEECPNTYLASCRVNWAPYFEYMITQVMNGEAIDADWAGGFAEEALLIDLDKKNVAEGTEDAVDEAIAALKDGELNVFDTANFTVKGKTIDSYEADVDTDEKYTPDTEVVEDGIFVESKFRSAPYFDIDIDGITLLN